MEIPYERTLKWEHNPILYNSIIHAKTMSLGRGSGDSSESQPNTENRVTLVGQETQVSGTAESLRAHNNRGDMAGMIRNEEMEQPWEVRLEGYTKARASRAVPPVSRVLQPLP